MTRTPCVHTIDQHVWTVAVRQADSSTRGPGLHAQNMKSKHALWAMHGTTSGFRPVAANSTLHAIGTPAKDSVLLTVSTVVIFAMLTRSDASASAQHPAPTSTARTHQFRWLLCTAATLALHPPGSCSHDCGRGQDGARGHKHCRHTVHAQLAAAALLISLRWFVRPTARGSVDHDRP